jgi:hypothetical protein
MMGLAFLLFCAVYDSCSSHGAVGDTCTKEHNKNAARTGELLQSFLSFREWMHRKDVLCALSGISLIFADDRQAKDAIRHLAMSARRQSWLGGNRTKRFAI